MRVVHRDSRVLGAPIRRVPDTHRVQAAPRVDPVRADRPSRMDQSVLSESVLSAGRRDVLPSKVVPDLDLGTVFLTQVARRDPDPEVRGRGVHFPDPVVSGGSLRTSVPVAGIGAHRATFGGRVQVDQIDVQTARLGGGAVRGPGMDPHRQGARGPVLAGRGLIGPPASSTLRDRDPRGVRWLGPSGNPCPLPLQRFRRYPWRRVTEWQPGWSSSSASSRRRH